MARVSIKKEMEVRVISGASKGKTGKVLRVDRENSKVWIEGVNRGKKAVRRSQAKPQGGLEEIERPIHLSNVMSLELWKARQDRKGAKAAGSKN